MCARCFGAKSAVFYRGHPLGFFIVFQKNEIAWMDRAAILCMHPSGRNYRDIWGIM